LRRARQDVLGGRRRVVLVAGEPGVGKTRLLLESGLQAEAEGWSVVAGHAYDSEGMPPFLPFIEALQQYSRTCSSTELRGQLGEFGPEIALLLPELRRRFPDLPEAAPIDPDSQRYLLFEGVSSLLRSIARGPAAGLLLCLEDIHWADASTLLLLEHVARQPATAPLLIIASYRDTELEVGRPLAHTLENLTRQELSQRIDLRRLSKEEVAALLAARGQSSPPASLLQSVFAETEGNPFFVQEVLEYLAGSGRLFDAEGGWQTGLSLGDADVPQGVRLVIGRRLERLSEECRGVLVLGALLGRTFAFALLREMAGLSEDALIGLVEEAERSQLLTAQASGQISFKHELIRQTFLAGVSELRRQRLHQRAAEAIESVYGDDLESHLGPLAVHYRLAAMAAPEKKIDYSVRAGEAAIRTLAWQEGAAHWQAALELMVELNVDPRRRADLCFRLYELLQFGYSPDQAAGIPSLKEAMKLYDELGDAERSAEMHVALGWPLFGVPGLRDLRLAAAHYDLAAAALTSGPERAAQADYYIGFAMMVHHTIHPRQGLAAAQRGLAIAEHLDDASRRADAAWLVGYHLAATGRLEEGFATVGGDLEASPATNRGRGLGATKRLYVDIGDPVAAQRLFEQWEVHMPGVLRGHHRTTEMRGLAEADVEAGEIALARQHLEEGGYGPSIASIDFREGNWDKAETFWAEEITAARAAGNGWYICRHTSRLLSQIYRLTGRIDQARALAEETLTWALDGGHVPYEMCARAELALLFVETGRPAEAESHLARCREIMAAGEDWRGLGGRVALAEGLLLAAEGKYTEADPLFDKALEAFRRYKVPWDEAEALYLRGRVKARATRGRSREALESFDLAIAIYREHAGGQRWIDRVEVEKQRLLDRGGGAPKAQVFPDGLSEREVEILRLIAAGKSNQQIADALVISLNTVWRHVSNIFTKIGASNRAEAATYAHRNALN
jgi:DNA-binding CsgD family transcriptional regulator